MKNHKTCGAKQALFGTYLLKKRRFLPLQIRVLSLAVFSLYAGGALAQSSAEKPQKGPIDFTANIQTEAARILNDPDRWSSLKVALEVGATAKFGDDIRARVVGQLATNLAPQIEDNYYPTAVRKDQRFNATVREAFVEMPLGNVNARIGKQYINWGEAVGVFVADVVNARDLRDFLLQDFDQLRIGQWAARFDWQGEDKSAEFVWIPVPTYDKIGAFGGDYYPIPYAPNALFTNVTGRSKPSASLGNSNIGVRGGFLKNGWDVAAFYYRSSDRETLFASNISAGGLTLTPTVGARISQLGTTLSKDLNFAVLKTEAVYTHGKSFVQLSPLGNDTVVKRNTVDWLVGLDVPIPESEARLNVQAIQRFIVSNADGLAVPRTQSYASVQFVYPSGNWEASLLAIEGLNKTERLLRPKLTYKLTKNTRVSLGADFFSGNANTLLGQYDTRDRVYVRLKHNF